MIAATRRRHTLAIAVLISLCLTMGVRSHATSESALAHPPCPKDAPAAENHGSAAMTTRRTHSRRLELGAWLGADPTPDRIRHFESTTHSHLDIVNLFVDWSSPFQSIEPQLDAVYSNGSTPMITWEPRGLSTTDIALGTCDAYIRHFARALRDVRSPVYVRPMHEMNFFWYSWSVGRPFAKNSYQSYIAAWKRVIGIFRDEHAGNAKFVWCILNINAPGTSYIGAYPGDRFVDVVAIDGYNWGLPWLSFTDVFKHPCSGCNPYDAVAERTRKPLMIAEWGVNSLGGDKAAWITDAFSKLRSKSFSRVTSAVYFNEHKEQNWLIDSSSDALYAYCEAVRTAGACRGYNPSALRTAGR